ncbi:hypothetical protein [Acrocarpospora catenulata]|uniref:hypothetical protein n=1 Tax=Acrocarpospora catenulata TaxID=2836182 RepID=UPI001BD96C5E|nr:hypothetical protein [Acrocarpospora catenulata]
MTVPVDEQLAGEIIAENFAGWSAELRREFADNAHNLTVGSMLLSSTDRVRVWYIKLAPGERLPAHRHVNDYFWTALRDGLSIQHTDDGGTRKVAYTAGQTRHFSFGAGEYLLHDLCNVGDGPIEFLTVEHLSGD